VVNKQDRITYLLRQVQENTATEAELLELAEALKADDSGGVTDQLAAQLEGMPHNWSYQPQKWSALATDILNADKQGEGSTEGSGKVLRMSWRLAAAAVILLVLGVSSYFLFFDKGVPQEPAVAEQPLHNDVPPGGDRAILTLANGEQILLDSAQGTVGSEKGVKIINLKGKLDYTTGAGENSSVTAYHTISTPRGGQYQLVLGDGTRVWLNAASSMRFPIAFSGQQRQVEITGEAYFEVAPNPGMPFVVKRGEAEVKVLGTHFNVNAYEDEDNIKVTLLEGKVRVGQGKAVALLAPGQQAQVPHASSGAIKVASDVDLDKVVAWKNGKFQFGEAAEVEDVLRQLSRWYDVEFEYQGDIKGQIGGAISRNVPISQVLNLLEMTGVVTFQLEGKKVRVRAS
jgi:transmembrane sensor